MMVTDLPRWQLNAKKWREENGFTGEEWQMYVDNRQYTGLFIGLLMYVLGGLVTGGMIVIFG